MQRLNLAPRTDWQAIAEANGFFFHHIDGGLYWDESACYVFDAAEIEETLKKAAIEIQELCLDLVDRACRDEELLAQFGIPEPYRDAAVASWQKREPTLYGRMDFSYNGVDPPKLLEYNADTPTSLYEAAWFQRQWLEDLRDAGILERCMGQFNSIHERLTGFFAQRQFERLHLACMSGSLEDRSTIAYLAAVAAQSGTDCKLLYMEDIGLTGSGEFVDLENEPIERLFKLYPWEYIWQSEFGPALLGSEARLLEPAWKMLISTKAILPLLWQSSHGHPNLLPASFSDEKLECRDWILKPMLGREGANIEIVRKGKVAARTGGDYANGRFVRQKLHQLPDFEGNFPVLGLWIVENEVCGLGIREDRSPITGDAARFVPHIIQE